MWKNVRCVVLNSTYEPLSIVSAKRGILLCFKGTASLLEPHPRYVVKSASHEFRVPTQVVLKGFVKARPTFRVPAQLTNNNLFTRDKYRCQYCGRHKFQLKPNERLTRDHVFPKDLGGRDVWENVVTACSTCNHKKANYPLSEVGMKLNKKPTTPTIFEIWSKAGSRKHMDENEYVEK